VEKCCTAGQATDDSMAHVCCMLDTLGYKHKLSGKYNTYSFSTATVVAQTCLNVSCMYFACLGNGKDGSTKSMVIGI
jgi:hypothetical protein